MSINNDIFIEFREAKKALKRDIGCYGLDRPAGWGRCHVSSAFLGARLPCRFLRSLAL